MLWPTAGYFTQELSFRDDKKVCKFSKILVNLTELYYNEFEKPVYLHSGSLKKECLKCAIICMIPNWCEQFIIF